MKKHLYLLPILVLLFTCCTDRDYAVIHNYIVVNGTSDSIVIYPNFIYPMNNDPDSIVLAQNQGFKMGRGFEISHLPVAYPTDSNLYHNSELSVASVAFKIGEDKFFEESTEVGSPLNIHSYAYVGSTEWGGGGVKSRPHEKDDFNILVNTFTLTYVFVLTEDYITSIERVGNGE